MVMDVKYIFMWFDDEKFEGVENEVVEQVVFVDWIFFNKIDLVFEDEFEIIMGWIK